MFGFHAKHVQLLLYTTLKQATGHGGHITAHLTPKEIANAALAAGSKVMNRRLHLGGVCTPNAAISPKT